MPSNVDSTEERILKAVEKAKSMEKRPNLGQIARDFDVPYQRLRARFHGRASKHSPKTYQQRLDPIQEQAIVRWWQFLDHYGRRPTHRDIEAAANRMVTRRGEPPVNKMWIYDFEKRCLPASTTKITTKRPFSKRRIEAEDIGLLSIWFDRLAPYLTTHGSCHILTENIYNMDETGFQLGVATSTRGPSQYVQDERFGSKDKGETVTVVECASAAGESLPAYVIFPGVVYMESWYRDGAPDDYRVNISQSGYINGEIALDWLQNHFDKHTKAKANGQKRLLFVDGHDSHITVEFLQYCENNGILPWLFLPNLTHMCQPLDQHPFLSHKQRFRSVNADLQQWGRYYDTTDKGAFLEQLPTIRQQGLRPRTIQDAFATVRIIPYNPEKVLNTIDPPGPDNEEPPLQMWNDENPSTPPQQDSSPIPATPPKSERSVSRFINKLAKKEAKGSITLLESNFLEGVHLIYRGY